jgi:hypothetical protein
MPVRIQNYGDYERVFGGLAVDSAMSYAVQQFFLNGGTDALIIRVAHSGTDPQAKSAELDLGNNVKLQAGFQGKPNPGGWANNLTAKVDHTVRDQFPGESKEEYDKLFNLAIEELVVDPSDITKKLPLPREAFRNLSVNPDSSRYVGKVLESDSFFVRLLQPSAPLTKRPDIKTSSVGAKGDDGPPLAPVDVVGKDFRQNKRGLYALEDADLFNLLVIPPLNRVTNDPPKEVYPDAIKYCRERRAMLLIDPPDWASVSNAETGLKDVLAGLGDNTINGAVFFPRIKAPDLLKENRLSEFVPSAVMAGLFARTDAQRGVWKAPAGIDAGLTGVTELKLKMTDGENGILNQIGINCLRTFPLTGHVSWGSRTLRGADRLSSEWKYIPVRRTALFLEESLYRGLQFAVFEPNDEPLWAQIRLNVGAFMQNLFRQGAFQGRSPQEAYLVKCDDETTIQNDIDRGIVNVLVGFAPLKPAEFVMVKIQQLAGQIQT